MGLLGIVFKVVGIVILAVIGLAAFLWFTDYQAEGEITEKGRDSTGDYVVIKPKLIPRDIRQDLDSNAASFVCVGYKVTYRIQSQHYQVLDADGRLVYDSKDGLNDAFSPVRCSTLPV